MQATQCPPRNRLKDYLAGKLDDDDSVVFERHLLDCPECELAAREIDNDPDTLVELLQIGPALAKMLRSLLRDRSSLVERQRISRAAFQMAPGLVSEDCQRRILSHLEKYPQLTDQNFWLAEPVTYRDETSNSMVANTIAPMDKVFRSAMLEHALSALSPDVQTAADLDQLRTHALMVIRSVI